MRGEFDTGDNHRHNGDLRPAPGMAAFEGEESVNTAEIVEKSNIVSAEQDARRGLVELVVQGNLVTLRTGERGLRRSRMQAVLTGALPALAGIALLSLSMWAAVLVVGGALFAVVTPRRIRPSVLATIDAEAECLVGSNAVSLKQVRAIRGVFETKGWDGFSVVQAELDDGSSVPILMLLGADERLAEAVCSELGKIAGSTAEYTGTSGTPVTCYRPAG